ncbi:SDR family oxidoreductase [Myxococcota bacterium]|nr:SDR family oxidoreductase [Myxococcota bacterium]
MSFLLTGATGFLGREVLARLLRRGAPVLVTSRPKPGEPIEAARQRLVDVVRSTDPEAPTHALTVAFGDVTHAGLGLGAEGQTWLEGQDRVHVIHGAAEVRFDLPWDVMHAQNVGGTENVLALARTLADRGRLVRVDHVSTAYVAGDRTDVAREHETDVGQRPRNDYERSKLAAELSVERARREGLPIAVHRPSIIVGDSRTGRASSFKVLYWPMKVYARGRWRTVFGRPGCAIDVVPVDYVADALVHLLDRSEAIGKTFHLAAGVERQSSITELVALAEQRFRRGRIRYVDPDFYMRWLRPIVRPILRVLRPEVAERGGVYLPYLRSNPSFAIDEATKLLAPAGLMPPRVTDYFDTILRYAEESDFGRRDPLLLGPGTADRRA